MVSYTPILHASSKPDIDILKLLNKKPLFRPKRELDMNDNKIREIRIIRENPRFRQRGVGIMKRYPGYKESDVKRTALINQVVTKGLDSNVEMKPSGMEWIGEIPAHWKVKRLKHVAEILPSNVDKHIYPDEIQVRLCNYTDVYYNDYITVDTVLEKGSCKDSEFT